MQFWAILVDSFRESLDRKIFWVVAGLTVLIVAVMASIDFEADHVSFFFGSASVGADQFDPGTPAGRAAIVNIVIYAVMDFFLGWIGVLMMIIATASFFPTMMEPGAIDVVLAKPISRPMLFLYKYFASMVFVFLQGLLFVGLMFLLMGLRWGVWAPGFLMSIPLLVLLFSYLYCISVFVGVQTRSPIAAILVSILAWVCYVTPPAALEIIEASPSLRQRTELYQGARVATWIPPKTGDIAYLAARFAESGTLVDVINVEVAAGMDEAARAQLADSLEREKEHVEVNPFYSIGSSLAFEAVFVALAMARFSRRDF